VAAARLIWCTPPHLKNGPVTVTFPTAGETPKGGEQPSGTESFTHPYTVFNFYAQSISLNGVNFFGLGNHVALAGKSLFGMNQTIVRGSVIKPVFEWAAIHWLNLAPLGGVNGRFVDTVGNRVSPRHRLKPCIRTRRHPT
jgi:hypothetical protein